MRFAARMDERGRTARRVAHRHASVEEIPQRLLPLDLVRGCRRELQHDVNRRLSKQSKVKQKLGYSREGRDLVS